MAGTKQGEYYIYGSPPLFNKNSDPRYKAINRLMYEQPPIVSIIPGRINFQSTDEFLKASAALTGIDVTGTEENDENLSNRQKFALLYQANNFESGNAKEISSAILKLRDEKYNIDNMIKASEDLKNGSARYFDFIPALNDYRASVSTLYGRMASVLDVNASFTPTLFEASLFAKLNYWVESSTNVSESMNTEVGPTVLNGLTGMVNGFAREAKFLLKEQDFSNLAASPDKTGLIAGAMQGISSFLSGDNSAGIRASLGDALLGMNPMFPEVWKNSTFDRGYTLNFKFYSPYSDKNSIARHVLFPFFTLLALVGPQQRTPTSYSEPYVFQLDCPGRFACDLGICTSFSFTRGGSEKLFTKSGLPRIIEVSMQVKDLYPTLMLSKNFKALYTNPSLALFLDNMAGLSLSQSAKNLSIFNSIEQRLDSTIFNLINLPETILNSTSAALLENPATAQIINIFRT